MEKKKRRHTSISSWTHDESLADLIGTSVKPKYCFKRGFFFARSVCQTMCTGTLSGTQWLVQNWNVPAQTLKLTRFQLCHVQIHGCLRASKLLNFLCSHHSGSSRWPNTPKCILRYGLKYTHFTRYHAGKRVHCREKGALIFIHEGVI